MILRWMILFSSTAISQEDYKKWGILLHKNLAILVPFECWMPKNPKKPGLKHGENLLKFWVPGFPWKSQPLLTRFLACPDIQVSPRPMDENSKQKNLESTFFKAREFHEIHADFGVTNENQLFRYIETWEFENPSKKNPPLSHCCPLIGPYYGLIAWGDGIGGESPLRLPSFKDIWIFGHLGHFLESLN